jgi:NodT family efflux transporter outer membrane factor (OMF) lipoprotein
MNDSFKTTPRWRSISFLITMAVFVILTSSCMVGPRYKRPPAPVPQTYKELPPESFKDAQGWKQAQPNDTALRGKWWEIYSDPQLNALEEQVNISNQNVLAAEAQFRQAREVVRVARAGLFPTVSAAPGITNSQSSGTLYKGGQLSSLVQQRTTFTLPFDFSYQADIWGSIRRTVAADVATAQATAAQLENARLSYQAQLAGDYFQLHGIDGEVDLLERTVKSHKDYFDLTRNRFEAGVASDADVAQAETQLETTQAQLIDLEVARAQFEHAIAILTGKPPSGLSISKLILETRPPVIPGALPSELLERRPDIAAAERQMASANEEIGLATAAYYPAVTLSASAGLESSSIAQWFTWPSKFWSVGPSLAETLFDAGRRHAQVAEAQAFYDTTVANYRQTVLAAFQQIEDNLAAMRVLEREATVQDQAVRSAERSLAVSTEQYKAGTADYLQVITTQATALQNQRSAIEILTRRMTSSVLLIEALGGGWNASELPSRDDIVHGK